MSKVEVEPVTEEENIIHKQRSKKSSNKKRNWPKIIKATGTAVGAIGTVAIGILQILSVKNKK